MKFIVNFFKKDHWPLFLIGNLSAVLNLLLPLFLVRVLSTHDMGIYKTFFLYFTLVPFLSMAGGPLNSVYYWISKKNDQQDTYLSAAWQLNLILSFLFIIPGILFFLIFNHQFSHLKIEFMLVLICAALATPAAHFPEVCIAKGKIIKGAILGILFDLLKIAGFIFIAYYYKDINLLLYFFLSIMLFSFLFMNFLGLRDRCVSFLFHKKEVKEIFHYSWPISLSSTLIYVVEKLDLIIISLFVSATDFAFYSMGCLLIPPLYLLESSVQKNIIPKLSIAYSENKFEEARKLMQKLIADIAFLIIPSVVGLFVFAKPIVELLYTSEYDASIIYLKLFAFSYLLLLIPHDSVIRASGKTKEIFKLNLIFLPLTTLALFLVVKYLEFYWAIPVSLFMRFLNKMAAFHISATILKSEIKQLIPWKRLFQYSFTSVILGILSWPILEFYELSRMASIGLGAIFAIIYLGIFYILKRNISE